MFWLLACAPTSISLGVTPWWDGPIEDTGTLLVEGAGPTLVINEVQSDNDSTIMTPEGDFSDWIELFNPGLEALELHRVTLWDQSEQLATFDEGLLEPGEHLLLWADKGEERGHLPFSLDASGDTLVLAVDGVMVDQIATGPMDGDTVWARYADGGSWEPSGRPTPGGPNGNAPGVDLDPSEQLFGTDRIHKVSLTLSDAGLDSLRASSSEEVPGSIGFLSAFFDPVSIRIKGGWGSLRTLDQKAGFKVDLDDYEEHRMRGQENLTLNNMVQDASFVHEYFAYRVYRDLDLPAPRVGWAELTINGDLWGLYLLVETVDNQFLERWFQDSTGPLFEGAYGVDLESGHEDLFEYDEGPDPDDRSDLTELIDVLNGSWDDATLTEVEKHIDMDRFVRLMAVEAVTLHWDGYTTANNYRLYHDPLSDRFTMLPWGCDQTWVDYWYMPYTGYGRLFEFCMAVERCTDAYSAALVEVADRVDAMDFQSELAPVSEWLADAIAADPRKEVTLDQVQQELEETLYTFETWPAEVRARVQ